MYLKELRIENTQSMIRRIEFRKGINLIVDETRTHDKKESGNNVGKTTVLRLIDFCLGSRGDNIYKDPEFRNKGGNKQISDFLNDSNVIITLILKKDFDEYDSEEIIIRRNFLKRPKKIQEINGKSFNNADFLCELNRRIFKSELSSPTFRQIIAKNIRYEKRRLTNTTKVLHSTVTFDQYEALFLFWLGLNIDDHKRKQTLLTLLKMESNLQKRLKNEHTLPEIEQSLHIINATINELENKKNTFNIADDFKIDLEHLNTIKSRRNRAVTLISQYEMKKDLIDECRTELEKEIANIDTQQIKAIYQEAKLFNPHIQKTFEDTLKFHNDMLYEKKKYIIKELPVLTKDIAVLNQELQSLFQQEKLINSRLNSSSTFSELEDIITELNKNYERKGNYEEQKRLWEKSNKNMSDYQSELDIINSGIASQEELLQNRVKAFNTHFSKISSELYGEQFVLSCERNDTGYELNISSIGGNPGTGKKKGQIAAFDLAYIQFADEIGIECVHFIIHDQIENVHENQITSLLENIVSNINCQYILPVLRDKLPNDIDVKPYIILKLSQSNKLFKI